MKRKNIKIANSIIKEEARSTKKKLQVKLDLTEHEYINLMMFKEFVEHKANSSISIKSIVYKTLKESGVLDSADYKSEVVK